MSTSTADQIALHALDFVSPSIHISLHRFFRRPEKLSEQDVVEILKKSLDETLKLYPPAAGTIRTNEQGEHYIAVDGNGGEFLVESRKEAFEGDGDDLSPRPNLFVPIPSPAFAVKVTQFSCGTISVAASLHHWAADLRGFLDFLATWSKIARSQGGRNEAIDLTFPDDWSHTPNRFFTDYIDSALPVPPAPNGYSVQPPPKEPVDFSGFVLPSANVSLWKIPQATVDKLKEDFVQAVQHVTEHPTPSGWISRGDALAALLWGAITRARVNAGVARAHARTDDTETLGMAADGRDRSPNKNMAGGRYFGNFNMLPLITVPRAELLSTEVDAAARVAHTIRENIHTQISSQAIADRLRFMEAPENAIPGDRIKWAADMSYTNWCAFDLEGEDMDFGFGRPFETTSGGGPLPPGFARLWQQKSSGDIFVVLAVDAGEAAAVLKSDALLTLYAHHERDLQDAEE
ncbi:hypothetical protein EIP91_008914 [Steccherinum ochraceum]|uniref:Transferase n=1 Tax=Steccherinum ochraceum TaxID=92696 RepID=A0A4R0RV91_9APHY|nr:hypothetical protein EIP91_008914 [Steccherinum ochraceum]